MDKKTRDSAQQQTENTTTIAEPPKLFENFFVIGVEKEDVAKFFHENPK